MQPDLDSPGINYPATIIEVYRRQGVLLHKLMVAFSLQEQKQFYEQIQKDKEDNDSTFLDVARVAVEKELQTTEEQPNQPKLDDQYQETDDQDQQHVDQGQQHNDGQQTNDQDYQDQQNKDQDHQGNDQDHQGNDQNNQQLNNSQDNDEGHSQQNDDQDQQLIDQSQLHQDINDQTNTNEQTGKTSTTEAENQDETPTDKQIVTPQSEVPATADTPQTPDAEKTKTEEAVTVLHEQVGDTQKQKDEVTDVEQVKDTQKQEDEVTGVSSTQNIVAATDEDTSNKPALPEPATQDTPQEDTTQESKSQQTLLQDDVNGAKAATESSENKNDTVAELSVANLEAFNVANPPLVERTNTQQTLTSVTMLDNPIRLEQLSRSSLDSDYSKKRTHQQIVQTISTTAINGDGKPSNDDVIAIAGTVDTGAVKSISSSTLSNITDLTE